MDKSAFWNGGERAELALAVRPGKVEARGIDGAIELRFGSSVYRGEAVRLFALAAWQNRPQKHPTVVLVHGGGGLAESLFATRAGMYWKAGANVISLDLPGKGEKRDGSRSTGPDMCYQNLFWQGEDLRQAYLYHAVKAVSAAIDAARECGCDTSRVLLDGWSWGGVVSLLAGAADDRVGAVLAVYGAGRLSGGAIGRDVHRLPDEQQRRWREAFDPGQQAYRADMESYLITGANDSFFALPDNVRTCQAMGSQAKLAVSPNSDHNLRIEYLRSLDALARAFVTGCRPEWAAIGDVGRVDGHVEARVSGSARAVDWVLADVPKASAVDWPKLSWRVAPAAVEDGVARIDAGELEGKLWYVSAHSADGLIASTGVHGLDEA